jgi:hypothetical protein
MWRLRVLVGSVALALGAAGVAAASASAATVKVTVLENQGGVAEATIADSCCFHGNGFVALQTLTLAGTITAGAQKYTDIFAIQSPLFFTTYLGSSTCVVNCQLATRSTLGGSLQQGAILQPSTAPVFFDCNRGALQVVSPLGLYAGTRYVVALDCDTNSLVPGVTLPDIHLDIDLRSTGVLDPVQCNECGDIAVGVF